MGSIAQTPLAFVDVETTGIDARRDGVVEVAVLVVRGSEILDEFASLVDPGVPISPHAFAVHGLRDEDVAGAPTLARLRRAIVRRCAGAVVVGHNIAFDLRFLPFLSRAPSLCTYRLARRLFPEAPRHTNQFLRAYLRLDDDELRGRPAHRALGDVHVTRRLLDACVRRWRAQGAPDNVDALREICRLPWTA